VNEAGTTRVTSEFYECLGAERVYFWVLWAICGLGATIHGMSPRGQIYGLSTLLSKYPRPSTQWLDLASMLRFLEYQ